MDQSTNKHKSKYERVMSRVYSAVHVNPKSKISVTRHDMPSARGGGKPSVSNVSSSVFSELPLVLNDYTPEEKPPQRTFVVKPRKTLKSLDPAKSPVSKAKLSEVRVKGRNIRAPVSAPSFLNDRAMGWSDSHVRHCYSSRSHTKLQELKSEISAYKEKEDWSKLRSRLFERCGVLLDEAGLVAEDKAVQAIVPESSADVRDQQSLLKEKVEPVQFVSVDSNEPTRNQDDIEVKVPSPLSSSSGVPREEKHKELKKELKRKRNRERQRAYYHRHKDLKKDEEKKKKKNKKIKAPKTNAERQREFRQRHAALKKGRKYLVQMDTSNQAYTIENTDVLWSQENAEPSTAKPRRKRKKTDSTSSEESDDSSNQDAVEDETPQETPQLSQVLDVYEHFSRGLAGKIKSLANLDDRVELMNMLQNMTDSFCASRAPVGLPQHTAGSTTIGAPQATSTGVSVNILQNMGYRVASGPPQATSSAVQVNLPQSTAGMITMGPPQATLSGPLVNLPQTEAGGVLVYPPLATLKKTLPGMKSPSGNEADPILTSGVAAPPMTHYHVPPERNVQARAQKKR